MQLKCFDSVTFLVLHPSYGESLASDQNDCFSTYVPYIIIAALGGFIVALLGAVLVLCIVKNHQAHPIANIVSDMSQIGNDTRNSLASQGNKMELQGKLGIKTIKISIFAK